MCSSRFATQKRLANHNVIHSEPRTFLCDVCNSSFKRQSGERVHKKEFHINEKLIVCDICGKTFVTDDKLKRHTRIHTGENPYKCKYCKNTFSFSSNMRSHMKVIHGNPSDRPKVPCTECEKQFADKKKFEDTFQS